MITLLYVYGALCAWSATAWVVRRLTRPRPQAAAWGVLEAYQFLLVGRLSLDEFRALDPDSQAALARVAEETAKDRAATLALATQDRETALGLADEVTGGAALEQVVMAEALGMAAARLQANQEAQRGVLGTPVKAPASLVGRRAQ